ncbi:MAG: hypothetical protein U1E17_01500 [Geminicoccaceae bacterium]
MAPISILGISGSLRQGSYNTMALKAAQALAPDSITVTIFDHARDSALRRRCPSPGRLSSRSRPTHNDPCRRRAAGEPGIQLLDPERAQERDRLGLARAPDQPFAGKPAASLGASGGLPARRACSTICASAGVSRRAPHQQARGDDRRSATQKFSAADGKLTDEAAASSSSSRRSRPWTARLKG